MEFTIRSASHEDSPAIAEIENECFSSPWSEAQVCDETNKADSLFFVAQCDGIICGYISGENICGEFYMGNLAVKSEYRKNKVAEKLLCVLINSAEKLHCEFITLEVRKSNTAAINLYEKCGFVLVGERKNFYSSPRENALIYTLYFANSNGKEK